MPYRFYLTSKKAYKAEYVKTKEELENSSGMLYPDFFVRTLVIVDGEPDNASLQLCKRSLYSEYTETVTEDEPAKNSAVTLLFRDGRTDILAEEIKAILSVNPYNSSITVRTGKQFVFEYPLSREQYESACGFFCDPLTNILESSAQNDGITPSEDTTAVGFNSASYKELAEFKEKHGLKIDIDDMMCIQNHFLSESREPTFAEIAVIDRFFGEDFRHTTFETVLDRVRINSPAALAAWEHYKSKSKTKKNSLSDVMETSKSYKSSESTPSIENRVRGIKVECDGDNEYLITFKGESRNRSVTVQPYDGAAGCLSELEKGSLCKLGYISDTYRVSGISGEPDSYTRANLASDGFNDYAAKSGIPCTRSTRLVSSSYKEKQLEFCAALSVSSIPAVSELFRKRPEAGDIIYLLGGRTGRDGSVCFDESGSQGEFVSVTNSGIMNSINRLIMRSETKELATAIMYVGSGGIICAIGKLACGAVIHTEKIPAKHSGLSAEELILSESAERMIVCVSPKDTKKFKDLCHDENVPFAEIAELNESERIVVTSAKNPKEVSIKTDFLLSGGTEKHRGATIEMPSPLPKSMSLKIAKAPLEKVSTFKRLFSKDIKPDLKTAFAESCKTIRFTSDTEVSVNDETVGSCMMTEPFSDKTPDASVRYLSYLGKKLTRNEKPLCSVIGLGVHPAISRSDPFSGAYLAVTEAVMKAVASGFGETKLHIAFQEYLPEYKDSSKQFGMALASLLGAYEAQRAFKLPSLGGRSAPGRVGSEKENNSGVAAFAIGISEEKVAITRDFKLSGSKVIIFRPEMSSESLPSASSMREIIKSFNHLTKNKKVLSAISVTARSTASGILEMCRASGMGFDFASDKKLADVFDNRYGSIIAELAPGAEIPRGAEYLGKTAISYALTYQKRSFDIENLFNKSNIIPHKYNTYAELHKESSDDEIQLSSNPEHSFLWLGSNPEIYGTARPKALKKVRALIPVNNYSIAVRDITAQLENIGFTVSVVSYSESSPNILAKAIESADLIYIPDCFGNCAFSKAMFMLPEITNALRDFRAGNGLIYGEGNGFEILLSCGLLELDEKRIGICDNSNGKAICSAEKIKCLSNLSPMLHFCKTGEYYDTVLSGRRLRLCAEPEYLRELAYSGRLAAQFSNGNISDCTEGIGAISSSDGRVLGSLGMSIRLNGKDFRPAPILSSAFKYFGMGK